MDEFKTIVYNLTLSGPLICLFINSRSSGRCGRLPGEIRDGCGLGMSATVYDGSGVTGQFFPTTLDNLV